MMADKLDNDRLLDNAGACSQHMPLLKNESLRECIVLNIIDPLKTEIKQLQGELERYKMANRFPDLERKAKQ